MPRDAQFSWSLPAWLRGGRRRVAPEPAEPAASAIEVAPAVTAADPTPLPTFAHADNTRVKVHALLRPMLAAERCLLVTGYQDFLSALALLVELRPRLAEEEAGAIRLVFGTNTETSTAIPGSARPIRDEARRHYLGRSGLALEHRGDLIAVMARDTAHARRLPVAGSSPNVERLLPSYPDAIALAWIFVKVGSAPRRMPGRAEEMMTDEELIELVRQGWLTFRQALSLGGHVRKGERGTTVVYADRFVPDDEKRRARETGEEAATIPFLKRFTVFNASQCDGLPEEIATVAPPPPPGLIEPRVEALIRATGIDFRIGGNRAFYVPSQDYVMVPPPQAYFEPIDWHRTALHELGHACGASHRLNRDLSGSFGTRKYAFEELIAEITAAFCCASLGIVPTVRHADYIASWLEVLREDNRAVVRAASQASMAADWLLSFLPDADGLGRAEGREAA